MEPKDLQYTRTHEWCLVEGDVITIGVTEAVAKKLGPILFVELPDPGDDVLSDEFLGEIESFKTVVTLRSPVDGTVENVNSKLADAPDAVSDDPYNKGWIAKIKVGNPAQLEGLLSYEEYRRVPKRP